MRNQLLDQNAPVPSMAAALAMYVALHGDGEPTAVDWIESLYVIVRDLWKAREKYGDYSAFTAEELMASLTEDPEATGMMLTAAEQFVERGRAALAKVKGRDDA